MVSFTGFNHDVGEAYFARPSRAGKFGGVVIIHNLPGWSEWITEVVRKFAHHGLIAIAPHLYFREGPGDPDDIGARVRAAGGVGDDQVMGDVAGAMKLLRAQDVCNGRIGVIGFCSGGRHTYLAACTLAGVDAAVDCWGGDVVVKDASHLHSKQPRAPIDFTDDLNCPLLGLFGNDDRNPSRADVDQTEQVLKRLGKTYEFHRYDGAGHSFMNIERVAYRAEQALDAWQKVMAFFGKHLA
jgi:carboxymethylenebutenolidase